MFGRVFELDIVEVPEGRHVSFKRNRGIVYRPGDFGCWEGIADDLECAIVAKEDADVVE